MNLNRSMMAVSIFAMMLIGSSMAGEVKTDYDRNTNFGQYKTYSWEKVKTVDPLWVDRIREAVDSALAAKGWTRVESGADVAVMAIESSKDHRTLNTFYTGLGGGWRWGGGFGQATTTVDHYKVGTLIVDLFDTRTKDLIWRGSASDTLSNKASKNIKSLDKEVQKMFHHFPPGVSTASNPS